MKKRKNQKTNSLDNKKKKLKKENQEEIDQNVQKQQDNNQEIGQIDLIYDEQKDSIKLKIQNREYEIDLKNQEIFKNAQLQKIINEVQDLTQLLKDKQAIQFPKIKQITSHYQYTALEYYLQRILSKINKKPIQEENCCICQFELFENIEEYTHDQFISQLKQNDQDVIGLQHCDGHYFHLDCISQMSNGTYIKCPICSKIYGVMIGDQPEGRLKVSVQNYTCDGYPKCKTIVMEMDMFATTKNGKHVPPTYRVAYLPDNEEGREIRDLIKIAFERKLVFTIGRSVTTGQDNRIVWNGIHMKTNTHGGSAHFGYPDPTYFNRVKQELALKGIY